MHKLKHRKVHFNITKSFFTVRGVECWNVAWKGCGISSPGGNGKSSGDSSEQPAPGDTAFHRVVKLDDLEAQLFCDSLQY